jgi:hypothetical protein
MARLVVFYNLVIAEHENVHSKNLKRFNFGGPIFRGFSEHLCRPPRRPVLLVAWSKNIDHWCFYRWRYFKACFQDWKNHHERPYF